MSLNSIKKDLLDYLDFYSLKEFLDLMKSILINSESNEIYLIKARVSNLENKKRSKSNEEYENEKGELKNDCKDLISNLTKEKIEDADFDIYAKINSIEVVADRFNKSLSLFRNDETDDLHFIKPEFGFYSTIFDEDQVQEIKTYCENSEENKRLPSLKSTSGEAFYANDIIRFFTPSPNGINDEEELELKDYIIRYLISNEPALDFKYESSRCIIIEGDPGQGKTTFSLYLAKSIFEQENNLAGNTFYFDLKEVNDFNGIKTKPINFFLNLIPRRTIESIERRGKAILIVDGLERLADNYLGDFKLADWLVKVVNRSLSKMYHKVHIIFTIRRGYFDYEDLIQANKIHDNPIFIIPLLPQRSNKIKDWLERYLERESINGNTRQQIQELKESIQDGDSNLISLLGSPMNLQLVVSQGFGGSSENTNDLISRIIENHIDVVVDRTREGFNSDLDYPISDELKALHGVVALILFQNDGIYSLSQLYSHDLVKELCQKIFSPEHQDVLLDSILFSLCFRKRFNNEEFIESIHDSFLEYLIAEYLKNQLIEIHQNELSNSNILHRVNHLFGAKRINQNIKVNFRELVERNHLDLGFFSESFVQYSINKDFYELGNPEGSYQWKPLDKLKVIVNSFVGIWFLLDISEQYQLGAVTRRELLILQNSLIERYLKLSSVFGYFDLNLSSLDFTELDMSGIKLIDSDLNNVSFNKVNLDRVQFRNSNPLNSLNIHIDSLSNADFEGMKFKGGVVSNVQFFGATFAYTDFIEVNFEKVSFLGCKIHTTKFENCTCNDILFNKIFFEGEVLIIKESSIQDAISRMKFIEVKASSSLRIQAKKVEDASFKDSVFEALNFSGVEFEIITFSNCILNNCSWNDIKLVNQALQGGFDIENGFIKTNARALMIDDSLIKNMFFSQCEFDACGFSKCTIANSNFNDTTFRRNVFYDLKLQDVTFSDCFFMDLYDLSNVEWSSVTFNSCFFINCDFSSTDLSTVSFFNCHFTEVSFEDSNVEKTEFNEVYLKGFINFEKAIVSGESFLSKISSNSDDFTKDLFINRYKVVEDEKRKTVSLI